MNKAGMRANEVIVALTIESSAHGAVGPFANLASRDRTLLPKFAISFGLPFVVSDDSDWTPDPKAFGGLTHHISIGAEAPLRLTVRRCGVLACVAREALDGGTKVRSASVPPLPAHCRASWFPCSASAVAVVARRRCPTPRTKSHGLRPTSCTSSPSRPVREGCKMAIRNDCKHGKRLARCGV